MVRKMTREEKLISMKMVDLVAVAEKLGIKINKKGSKEKAIEKIIAAEADQNWDDDGKQLEKIKEEKKAKDAESDTQAENAVNKKKAIFSKDEITNKNTPPEKKSPGRGALLEYNGEAKNICAWAKELGISANTLYGRIYRMGWSIEKAFETPSRK